MTAPRDDEPRQVEAYLDVLLATHDHEPTDLTPAVPSLVDAPLLDDPRLIAAADALRTSLVRSHPSFRFEDRLAARLRAAARARSAAAASTPSGAPTTVLFPGTGDPGDDIALPVRAGGTVIAFPGSVAAVDDADASRGLLLGGAIASGVTVAGAALFAWRRQRNGRGRHGIA
jgi:hypothetical protein